MEFISNFLGVLYLLIIFVLAMYGFHNLLNAVLYLISRAESGIVHRVTEIRTQFDRWRASRAMVKSEALTLEPTRSVG